VPWLPGRAASDVGRDGTMTTMTTTIGDDDGDIDVATTKTTTTTTSVRTGARRELDVGITYRRGRRRRRRLVRPDGRGRDTLEIVLGGSGSDVPVAAAAKTKRSSTNDHLLVRLAVGKGGRRGSSSSSSIEYARGSFRLPRIPLFFLRSKGGVSVMPSYDFVEGSARCVLSGDVGSSGRTRAVLRLDADDSTLTLVRALDGRRVRVFFFLFFFRSSSGANPAVIRLEQNI
jgi:hypothetical protein